MWLILGRYLVGVDGCSCLCSLLAYCGVAGFAVLLLLNDCLLGFGTAYLCYVWFDFVFSLCVCM